MLTSKSALEGERKQVMQCVAAGDYDEAVRHAEAAVRIAEAVDHPLAQAESALA